MFPGDGDFPFDQHLIIINNKNNLNPLIRFNALYICKLVFEFTIHVFLNEMKWEKKSSVCVETPINHHSSPSGCMIIIYWIKQEKRSSSGSSQSTKIVTRVINEYVVWNCLEKRARSVVEEEGSHIISLCLDWKCTIYK